MSEQRRAFILLEARRFSFSFLGGALRLGRTASFRDECEHLPRQYCIFSLAQTREDCWSREAKCSFFPLSFSFFWMVVRAVVGDCYIFQTIFRNDRSLTQTAGQWSVTWAALPADTRWFSLWRFYRDKKNSTECMMRSLKDEWRQTLFFFFL